MSEHDEDKWVRVRTEENERGKRKTEEEEKKEKEMKVVEEEKGEKSTEDKLKEIGETLKGSDLREKTAQWETECQELRDQLDLLWGEMRGMFREWWRTKEFENDEHEAQHHQARTAVVITALGEIPEMVKNDSLSVYCPELSDLQEEALLVNAKEVNPSPSVFKTVPIVIDMMKQRAENSQNNQTHALFNELFSNPDVLDMSPEMKEAGKESMKVIRSFTLLQFSLSVLLVFYGQIEEEEE